VVRLHDGRFVALSARLALERVFSVVRYDVELNLRAAGRDGDADRAMNFWRSMCELDAFDSLATMAPATGPLQRLYREPELQAAFARGGKKGATAKSADAAIEYPGAWLVAEVTSSALTRTAAVGGSVAALVADLAKIEAKARQLQTTMDALRADDTRLTGRLAAGGRRFVPLLVMAEGFPVNAATTTALRAQLAAKGILAAPDIAPLHVIDAEELAMAESLVEQGTSLLDLLDGHARGNFRAMSLRDYILVERKATPGLPKRLQDAYERAWAPIFAAVPTSPTT
jgi:hypothetical protein